MNEVVGFLALVIPAMVPFVLAAQGTILSGRAGVFNVSQEGVMVLGASVGFLASFTLGGNTIGLLVAAAAGGLVGLIL
ncbi:ABC transporter permease, partial [Aeromicrobium phragmitis]